ncbi:interferon lambda receptor 1-like [Arapaima gigas]
MLFEEVSCERGCFSSDNEEKKRRFSHLTNVTVLNLTNVLYEEINDYNISIQAIYKNRSSPASFKMFSPWSDTELGPPEVLLVQSENCLLLTVNLPRGRAKMAIEDIYIEFRFEVHLSKSGDQKVDVIEMTKRNHMFCELEVGAEYCVRVHTRVASHKKMRFTDLKCALVKSEEQSSAVFISLVLLGVVLLLGGIVLLGLVYTGYLCKQKIHHPAVLKPPLKSYFPAAVFSTAAGKLIPEEVSMSPKAAHLGKPNRTLQSLSTESSDEEDGEENQYLNWKGRPLSVSDCNGMSHCTGSSALLSTTDTSRENSGNSGKTVLSSDQEDPQLSAPAEASGEPEDDTETATVHMYPEGSNNMVEDSMDVNLLSVVLGSLEQGAAQGSPEQSRTLLPVVSGVKTLTDRLVPNVAQTFFGSSVEEEDDSQEDEDECSNYMRR